MSCISINKIIPGVFAIEFKPNCLLLEFFECVSFWLKFKFFVGEPMQYREFFKPTMLIYNNLQKKVLYVKRSILQWSKINLFLLPILLG